MLYKRYPHYYIINTVNQINKKSLHVPEKYDFTIKTCLFACKNYRF